MSHFRPIQSQSGDENVWEAQVGIKQKNLKSCTSDPDNQPG